MTWSTLLTIAVIIVVFVILFKVFKWVLRLLVLVVFLLIAFVTNPDIDRHREAVERKLNTDASLIPLERDDYYVFSLTQSVAEGDRRVIGAGAFTQVVIFREP